MVGIPTLRDWQNDALLLTRQAWLASASAKALIAACPGGGKTLLSARATHDLLSEGEIDLAIIVVPTINIQLQWRDEFERNWPTLKATTDASNAAVRWRQKAGQDETEGNHVLIITYQQLARDKDLFVTLAERRKVLLVADEVHHADDAAEFGAALDKLSEVAVRRLALSGTPFNTKGGALAMCDSDVGVDDEGRQVRVTRPIFTYSYGQAITANVCRPLEFIKVFGRGQATYRSLADDSTFQKSVDLAKENKTDRVGMLLDPQGEFMGQMIAEGLEALQDIKEADPKAGLLVVARNTAHGGLLAKAIAEACKQRNLPYSIQEIYNDSPKAHDRIKEMATDRTDIVVSVRMISEGVDIKRLRVGLYATDYMTRMFFIQFVGRFVRWEDRLDESQHARVIVPAHITLLEYAREIEVMIDSALMPAPPPIEGEGGSEPVESSEFLFSESEADGSGVVYRGEDSEERELGKALLDAAPTLRGVIGDFVAIQVAKELGLAGATLGGAMPPKKQWRKLNELMVRGIVRRAERLNGEDDAQMFAKFNSMANKAVGVLKIDDLTPEDVLIRRHAWLKKYFLERIVRKAPFDDATA